MEGAYLRKLHEGEARGKQKKEPHSIVQYYGHFIYKPGKPSDESDDCFFDYTTLEKHSGEGYQYDPYGDTRALLSDVKNVAKKSESAEDSSASQKTSSVREEYLELAAMTNTSRERGQASHDFLDFLTDRGFCVGLVFEQLHGDHLADFVFERNLRRGFFVSDIRLVAKQLFQTAAYLHKRGFTHTDFKHKNVMFCTNALAMVPIPEPKDIVHTPRGTEKWPLQVPYGSRSKGQDDEHENSRQM